MFVVGMVQIRMAVRSVGILAISAALVGCTSDSQEVLAREVEGQVSVGMSGDLAASHLVSVGFRCGHNDELDFTPNELRCARTRSYYLVASCVQRVDLTLDQMKVVRHVASSKPSCAGL